MACFIAPLVEAIAVTAIRKTRPGVSRHIADLEKMLWGGTLMLVVDHIINGEVIFKFPFFSALANGGGWSVMLREIVTVGIPMAAVLTIAWAIWAVLKEKAADRARQ